MDTELTSQWMEQGYVVVRGIYTAERAALLQDISERILAQWRTQNPENGEPGGDRNAAAMRHLNHAGYFAGGEPGFVEIMDAIAAPSVLEVCRSILGEEPLFRCTSLFMNPLDTSNDGSWHRDSQFHHPDEEEEKKAIADGGEGGHAVQLQVALVASADVEVVPASHKRWDTPEEYAIRRADGGKNSRANNMLGAVRVALEPGDAVAFNPWGLHRGRYHVDKLRRTLMLTYTKTSKPRFDYFSDQPWFDTPQHLDGLQEETRAFFEPFIAEYGEQWRHKAAEE
jgi:hypothetical protein